MFTKEEINFEGTAAVLIGTLIMGIGSRFFIGMKRRVVGVYGIFLNTGQMGMKDTVNGPLQSISLRWALHTFLNGGPCSIGAGLVFRGADWTYPEGWAMIWSARWPEVRLPWEAFCVLLRWRKRAARRWLWSICVLAGGGGECGRGRSCNQPAAWWRGSIKAAFF